MKNHQTGAGRGSFSSSPSIKDRATTSRPLRHATMPTPARLLGDQVRELEGPRIAFGAAVLSALTRPGLEAARMTRKGRPPDLDRRSPPSRGNRPARRPLARYKASDDATAVHVQFEGA
jgi:hypothetical protein